MFDFSTPVDRHGTWCTQWDYIARIVEDIVEKLDVDITAASEAIRTRFGSSGVESLLGSKLPPKDE